MSKLDELIKKLCPDGVEFKELWELTIWDKKFSEVSKEKQEKVVKFKHILAKELKDLDTNNGDIRLLSTGNYIGYTTETLAKDFINIGEVIAIPSGGSANIKYYNGKFVDSGNILCIVKNKQTTNLKYIFYFILDNIKLIEQNFRGSGIKHPNMSQILDISIPLPPLQVQEEIVRILDTFTGLIDNLNEELVLRKKQYEYYRNKLLTFKEKK